MKKLIKSLIGLIKCILYGIKTRGGVYIGKDVHIIGGSNITFGKNVQIRPYCDLFAGRVFRIGNGCDIGERNRIAGEIVIEDCVLFGPDNFVCSYDHTYEDITVPILEQPEHAVRKNGHNELRIGSGSWIGTHCSVIGDVHIGKNCVIGANSVVTKDVPDYCVVAGNPARIIKRFNIDKGVWEKSFDFNNN